jgi:hypothetical protein
MRFRTVETCNPYIDLKVKLIAAIDYITDLSDAMCKKDTWFGLSSKQQRGWLGTRVYCKIGSNTVSP